ncbi:MAG: hypothetical protein L3J31_06530 [Bacteroidales bacterium]|nr:hypothetical protein [Bacteroidales bacterium]MCF6342444.1 hypothetical protein [Bacteroidales bacterium]
MKTRIVISLMFLTFFFGQDAFGQKLTVARLEVPSALEVETFHVETLDVFGVLVFYESNEVNNEDLRKWYFALFNKSVKQQWLKFVPLPDKIEFVQAKREGHKLHMLFKNIDGPRFEKGFYEIVTYDLKAQTFENISGFIPLKSEIAGFEVIGNTACLGLNLKKEETDVLFINLGNGDISPVHVQEGNQNMIGDILVDKRKKKFYAVLKTVKDKRYMTDEIIVFSRDGKQESVLGFNPVESLKLMRSFILVPDKSDKLTFMGTYDVVVGRNVSFNDLKEGEDAKGAGMFFLQFAAGKQQVLNFYDFLSFENIYGSFSGREMDYSRNNVKAGDNPSKKNLSAFFHFNNPQVFLKKNQYVFSVELYKPYYRTETRMEYDYYGMPRPYTYTVFEGYSFYDLIVAAVNLNGELVWNNDFPINNMKSYSLSPKVAIFDDDDYISMAYVNDGKIHSLTIEGPVDIGREESAIETNFTKDRIAGDVNNFIEHWYGDYFLIYGYQKLRNRTLGDQSTRTVFYANKVAYK